MTHTVNISLLPVKFYKLKAIEGSCVQYIHPQTHTHTDNVMQGQSAVSLWSHFKDNSILARDEWTAAEQACEWTWGGGGYM